MDIKLTPDDYAKYPYHTEGSIKGIKYIEGLTSVCLKAAVSDDDLLERIRLQVGKGTNPNWVLAQIAETLYKRDEIDELELDRLMR